MLALIAFGVVIITAVGPTKQSVDSLAVVREFSGTRQLVGRARFLVVGQDGRVYIVDDSANTMVSLDRDGNRSIVSLGHSQRSPTEHIYSSGGVVGTSGRKIWVWDRWNAELVTVGLKDGQASRSSLKMPTPSIVNSFYVPRALFDDGSYIAEQLATSASVADLAVSGRVVLHAARDGTVIDTIGILQNPNGVLALQKSDGRMVVINQPWAAHDIMAVSSDGDVVAIVRQRNDVVDSMHATFSLTLRNPSSKRANTRTFAYSYDPIRLTDDTVNAFIDRMANASFGRSFSSHAAAARAIGEELFRPFWSPAVFGLSVTSANSVWITETDSTGAIVWANVDGNGRPQRKVRPPPDADLLGVAGPLVWVLRHNSAGERYLAVCRIVPVPELPMGNKRPPARH
jgi:hypothetical protein